MLQRHGAPDERFGRAGDAVHDVVDALQIEFWKYFGTGSQAGLQPSDERFNASSTMSDLVIRPSTNTINPGA